MYSIRSPPTRLSVRHGPSDGAAGDGLVPLVGLRDLLITMVIRQGFPPVSGAGSSGTASHTGEGSCLVSEPCSRVGQHLRLWGRERERERGREGGKET